MSAANNDLARRKCVVQGQDGFSSRMVETDLQILLLEIISHDIKVFNPYPANVENMVAPNNISKWQMGFNSAFKVLKVSTERFIPCILFL